MRTYDLISFLKTFMHKIQTAITELGVENLYHMCINKMAEEKELKKSYKRVTLKDVVMIKCYFKGKPKVEENEEDEENKSDSDEDCNLSDNEEEKTQVKLNNQKKALLSVDKILKAIKAKAQTSLNLNSKIEDEIIDEKGCVLQKYRVPFSKQVAK